jgi:lipopolysaccharide transport system ATP-binding protein
MPLAIKVENLSKQYRLGQIGTGTLSHDLNRFWASIRGKEDPYAQVGSANDRTQKAVSAYVWALKDINFEIEQGDAVGIIGRNGAGKSTLLKILSRTTLPTTGSVKMKGRIASLLEVGTGFHPEMTGRENIYQNGAILGMTRHEITRKFDEIVDFSGCEAYIDTPVKRYSSGMYVRLAFAVAAHLESEILIVDEVLAVGDAEFQKKCLGKMSDISKGEGRTVLFVSHNIPAINVLCNKAILLANGKLLNKGHTKEILSEYLISNTPAKSTYYQNDFERNGIKSIRINTSTNTEVHEYGKPISVSIETVFSKAYGDIALAIQFIDEEDSSIINPLVLNSKVPWIKNNVGLVKCDIMAPKLYKGNYFLTFHIGDKATNEHIQTLAKVVSFQINMDNVYSEYGWIKGAAKYIEDYKWKSNLPNSK